MELKTQCEGSANFVSTFFSSLCALVMLITSVLLWVVLKEKFEAVWGSNAWDGNQCGRLVKSFWGFGILDASRDDEGRRVSSVVGRSEISPRGL